MQEGKEEGQSVACVDGAGQSRSQGMMRQMDLIRRILARPLVFH
jgi:hypothetical protein